MSPMLNTTFGLAVDLLANWWPLLPGLALAAVGAAVMNAAVKGAGDE